jgi:hypothetical protein
MGKPKRISDIGRMHESPRIRELLRQRDRIDRAIAYERQKEREHKEAFERCIEETQARIREIFNSPAGRAALQSADKGKEG